jgi:pilus assembly protein Flp/PilA
MLSRGKAAFTTEGRSRMVLPRRALLTRRALRRRRDTGASAVEYALLVAAVAAVVVAVVLGLAGIVRDAFQGTTDCVSGSGADCPASTTP